MLTPTIKSKKNNSIHNMTALSPEMAEAADKAGTEMHGLTFWSFNNRDIDRQSLEDAWVAEGLPTEQLPPARNPVVSLSRAVASKRGKFSTAAYTGQVTAYSGKKDKSKGVLAVWYLQTSYVKTAEQPESADDDKDIDIEDLVGRGATIYHESMVVWLRADGVVRAKNMETDSSGKALPMTDALTTLGKQVYDSYTYIQNNLDSAKDMSPWLSSLVRSLKATLVRPQGGLYLVLGQYKNSWDRIVRAVEAAYKRDIVFSLPVIASSDTARLVLAALTAEYEELAEKIIGEMEKSSKMRSDGIATRNKRIEAMVEKLQEFETAMSVSTSSLQDSLVDLKFALSAGRVKAAVPEQEKISTEPQAGAA
jgi:hypothetical protein